MSGFFITTESEYANHRLKGRLVKRIKIPYVVDGMNLEFFIPYDYTNGINFQKIEDFSLGAVLGGTYSRAIFKDRFDNKKIRISLKNLRNEIILDYAFTFSSRVALQKNTFIGTYPFSKQKLKLLKTYLSATSKVQLENPSVAFLLKNLLKDRNKLEKVVVIIINWIKNNIIHDPSVSYDDALTTFLNKKGNNKGIINLCLTMLRDARIPCRAVKGVSVDKSYLYKAGGEYFEIKYPNGYYFWVEVFSPTRAWIPFDHFSSFFFIPDNLIRLCVGNDTEDIRDIHILSNGAIPPVSTRFFFEQGLKIALKKVVDHSDSVNGILIIPAGNDSLISKSVFNSHKHINNLFNPDNYPPIQETLSIYPIFQIKIPKVTIREFYSHLTVNINKDTYYAQAVEFYKPFYLDSINIPFYNYGLYPAEFWVEIYPDNNGKPGNLLYKSIIKIKRETISNDITWEKFFFNKQNLQILKKGKYWFSLRTSGEGRAFWYGFLGNLYGNGVDTRTKTNVFWDTLSNVDLALEVWGNYYERP